LEELICDDYVGVDPPGLLIDKEVSVGRYRRPDFALSQRSVSDISVCIFDGITIEIGAMNLKGHLGSFEFGGRYRYSHVWLNAKTKWKVRASQLTPILRDVA